MSREEWFLHPWEYFSNKNNGPTQKPGDLTGRVWTFNRYGLWRRLSIATCCFSSVTANHGCYTYYLKGVMPKELSDRYWELLVAWFNSTFYLISMFEHAKIPAKHVQQVNLLEHRQMMVPRIRRILEHRAICNEIITAVHNLDKWLKTHPEETLPAQMRACVENTTHPRIQLDLTWFKVLNGIEQVDSQNLRSTYARIENLLNDY